MWPEASKTDFNQRQKKIRDLEWNATVEFLASIPKGNFLEIGCGTGYALNKAAELGFNVTGIDPAIGKHGVQSDTSRLNVVTAVAEKLPYADGSFDVVYSSHALEHFSDPHYGLKEMSRVLKPGGTIIILVPSGMMALINYVSQLIFTTHIRFARFLFKRRDFRHFFYILFPQAHGEHARSVLEEVLMFSERSWRALIGRVLQIKNIEHPGLYPYPDFPQWFPHVKLNKASSSVLFVCSKS